MGVCGINVRPCALDFTPLIVVCVLVGLTSFFSPFLDSYV